MMDFHLPAQQVESFPKSAFAGVLPYAHCRCTIQTLHTFSISLLLDYWRLGKLLRRWIPPRSGNIDVEENHGKAAPHIRHTHACAHARTHAHTHARTQTHMHVRTCTHAIFRRDKATCERV